MFRPTLLRTALPRAATRLRPTAFAQRFVSTADAKAPTNSVIAPSSVDPATKLPEGEEIDPQLNGYPQLPYVSLQRRPALGWWDVQDRRNFGETLHEEEDALGMWGPDDHKTSGSTALVRLIFAFSVVLAVNFTLYQFFPERKSVPRSFPYNGLEKELGGYPTRKEEDDYVDE